MLPPLFAEALVAACPASSPRFSLVPSPSSAKATGAVSPQVRVAVVTAARMEEGVRMKCRGMSREEWLGVAPDQRHTADIGRWGPDLKSTFGPQAFAPRSDQSCAGIRSTPRYG